MSLIPFNRQDRLAYKPFTNLLDDFFGDAWHSMRNLPDVTFKLDVREELLHYAIEAEMPGVAKEDIAIEFRDGYLTIGVSQKEESAEEAGRYIHRERHCTSARRSVFLAEAKAQGITAALSDGVLHITVPKAEEEKKQTIAIH